MSDFRENKPLAILYLAWAIFFISLPLLYTEACYEVFALRKTIFITLVGIHILCWPFLKKPPFIQLSMPDLILPGFFFIRLLSFFWSQAFWEAEFSLEGLAFEGSLLLFWLLMRSCPPSQKWFNLICRGLVISIFLVALMQLLKFPFIKPMLENRISAQFFHPNVLGIICAALGLKMLLWRENQHLCHHLERRQNIYLWFAPAFIVMVLSGSKGAFFAFFCGVLFFCPQGRRILPLLVVLLLITFVPRLLLSPVERYRNTPGLLMTRIEGFKSVLNAIYHHPAGIGPGLFHMKIHPYITADFHNFFPHPAKHSLNRAHSWPLEITFESSILFLPFLLWAIYILYRSPISENKAMVFVLFIGSLYCVHLNYPTSQMLFALFLLEPSESDFNNQSAVKKGLSFYLRLFFCVILAVLLFYYSQAYFNAQSCFRELQSLLNTSNRSTEINKRIQTLFTEQEKKLLPVLRAENLYFRFMFLIENRNYSAAQKLGHFLQARFQGYYQLEYYLAVCYLEQNKLTEALYFCEKAIDYHPLDEENYRLLAHIYQKEDNISAAEKARQTFAELQIRNKNFCD